MNEDVTMKEFEALIEEAYRLKSQKEELEEQAELIGCQLKPIQTQLLAYLEQFEKTSYKSRYGNIIRVEKMSVTTPKDPESKEKFFAYLEAKGIKEQMLTVNSKTLNSFYAAERDAAIAGGAEEFQIPGISEPTVYFQLTMRK